MPTPAISQQLDALNYDDVWAGQEAVGISSHAQSPPVVPYGGPQSHPFSSVLGRGLQAEARAIGLAGTAGVAWCAGRPRALGIALPAGAGEQAGATAIPDNNFSPNLKAFH